MVTYEGKNYEYYPLLCHTGNRRLSGIQEGAGSTRKGKWFVHRKYLVIFR